MNNYKIGLVGLTNVGKSSIFNFLTEKKSQSENRFFVTLDPEYANFKLLDKRLEVLKNFWKPKRLINSEIQIIDIPGLIKGAHLGYGLGNEFLSFIRESDAIFHVTRCFKDERIEHSETTVDPLRDFLIVRNEMLLSDLNQIERKLERGFKKKEKEISKLEKELLEKIAEQLREGKSFKKENLTEEEEKIIKGYNFLSSKPFLVLLNSTKEKEGVREIIEYCQKESLNYSIFSPKLAEETLNYKQKIELSEKIKESFYLKTFFTVGKDEVRSWLTRKANQARKCAGLIHSDIEKGFIRVKVYNYEEWMRDKKIQERKEKEDYLVKDGDICNFLFNKSKRIN